MSLISENLEEIKQNIERAALKSLRKSSDITLVGVTKTIDTDRINELLKLGVKDLGENKVQELMSKYDILADAPNWHLIGHLQTNKVKYIIDKVKLIHSVDSLKLANEINKHAERSNKIIDILIEINIANENTKNGISPNEVEEFVLNIRKFGNLCIKGLMTIAPFVDNPEENRFLFRKMFQLFVDIKAEINDNINMQILSMGMTNDYQVAIEEGANMVRVGTGLFGARKYDS